MFAAPRYTFSGDPVSQALAAKVAQQHLQSQASENAALYGAQAQYGAAREQANALRDSTLYQQPARFAETMGGMYDAYGRNSAGALGNYLSPYSQATQGYMSGQAALGRGIGELYGAGVGALGGLGQSAMAGLANMGSNLFESATRMGSQVPAALASAYGNAVGARASAAGARSNALGQLGAAGQGAQANIASNALGAASSRDQAAMGAAAQIAASANQARAAADAARFSASGNVGSAKAAALANQAIAAANGLGQMGVANYNMQGQLGNALAGVAAAQEAARGNAAAAQQAAGPQYARANLLAGILPGLLDTVRAGFAQPGGSVGFDASGPDGMIASGRGSFGGAGGSSSSSAPRPFTMGAMGTFAPPALPDFGGGVRETRSLIDSLLDRNDRPESQANLLRNNMMSEFAANRGAIDKIDVAAGDTSAYTPDYSMVREVMGATNYDPMRLMGAADAQLQRSMGSIGYDDPAGDMGGVMDRIQSAGQGGFGAIGGLLSGAAGQMQGFMDSAGGRINDALTAGANGIGGFGDRLDAGMRRFANDARNAYGGVSRGLESRFDQTFNGVNDMWNRSLGRLPQFMSPTDLAAQEIAAQRMRDQASWEDRVARQQRIARERDGVYRF